MVTRYNTSRRLIAFVALAIAAVVTSPVAARTQLKNICRIKGQEENKLRGLGLVIGLNGTGEAGDVQTMQAIDRAMQIMGSPRAQGGQLGGLEGLRKMKNTAYVMVTATVPATGARRGNKLTCYVSALNGKSLKGGRLAFASLLGPDTQDKRVYASCEGQVVIDDPSIPTVGVVHGGCQMEADVFTPFVKDGFITLVLDSNHANFYTADVIAKAINKFFMADANSKPINERRLENTNVLENSGFAPIEELCHAIDATNIKVRISEVYRNDPVALASDILDINLYEHEPEARVVINSRAGIITIGGDVEIGDIIVSHKNVVVDVTAAPRFSAIDVDKTNDPNLKDAKLKALVDQLNSLKVPTEDMIEIIRAIEKNGKLHARLIID